MTLEDVRAAIDVVAGILLLESQHLHALIVSVATHFFIAKK